MLEFTLKPMSAEEHAREASRHLQRTLLARYAVATECLLGVCAAHVAGSDAVRDGDVVVERERLLELAEHHSAGLSEALAQLLSDEQVPSQAKKRFAEWGDVCSQVRDAAEEPAGSVLGYMIRCARLRGEYQRLGEELVEMLKEEWEG